MFPRRHRASIDQVSEFERGRIVAYRDCGLSFRERSQHVVQNQATVMRICHHWMQEETIDRRVRSHPPRCTTASDNRRIVCTTVMDRATTSRTIAQQIQSVAYDSVSSCTIRRHLQQSGMSARCPLLRLP
ncbi:transposable element Tcb1 transposase [Trichonephila clavipes]|nr:transposable element Tcb1 transposase [Trichonephila clavipes]